MTEAELYAKLGPRFTFAFVDAKGQPVDSSIPSAPKELQRREREVRKDRQQMADQDRALNEFKVVLAKYYANREHEPFKIAAVAVANFLTVLWPELEEKLKGMKDEFENPRFSL